MKTNHQRGFKDSKDPGRYAYSPPGGTGKYSEIADKAIGACWGGDNSNGHRGYAKAKRGGKKFVNSRIRFHENQAVNRIAGNLENEEE
jgi:hypothetical protein